jgi:hypothetical protein
MAAATSVDSDVVDLVALVRDACARATSIAELSPELVLGLASEEVSRLRNTQSLGVDPFAEARDNGGRPRFAVTRTTWSQVVCAPDKALRADVSRRLNDTLSELGRERDLRLCLELHGEPLDVEVIDWLRVALPRPDRLTSQIRLVRRQLAYQPQAGSPENDPVIVEDQVVGQWHEDGSLRLFVHPWVNHQGQVTTAAAPRRGEAFASLLDAALAQRPPAHIAAGKVDAHDQQMREAIRMLDLLPTFDRAASNTSDADERRNSLSAYVRELDRDISDARDTLVELLRRRGQSENDLRALERGDAVGLAERALVAITQLDRIRRLPTVRSISLAADNDGNPAITVTLQPLVMTGNNTRRLLRRLRFALVLAEGSPRIVWDPDSWGGSPSPHPHVSLEGTTCWGDAVIGLHGALGSQQYARAVLLISGWAREYNHDSPYVEIRRFEHTRLAPGWHPEIDAGFHDETAV